MTINYSPRISTDGLVLCLDAGNTKSYPGSGTTWSDLSKNGAVGTLVNGPTFSSINSGVLTFDGVDDRINVMNSIPSLSELTIELFLRTSVVDSTQNIFLDQLSSLRYEITNTNKFNIHLGTGSAWIYTFLNSSTTIVANTWYHTAWTWSGSTAVIYVNGVAENSLNNAAASSGTGLITLGQHTPDTSYAWAGNMSNVKIYNRALSASEIQQNFQALRGRYGI
jgi:hypothetical protein